MTVGLELNSGGRLRFIDGLRGVAALSVIVPHAVGLLPLPSANSVARLVARLAPYLSQGVQVFFVVSGFAIAYSLRDIGVGPHFRVARFMVRRAVRLDPPYWLALILFGFVAAARAVAHHQSIQLPSLGKSLAHLFYLQDLTGYGQFNVVFWTLCLEFQLYLVYAAVLRLIGRLGQGTQSDAARAPRTSAFLLGAFLVSFVLSHVYWPGQRGSHWFVPYFYVFLAGSLTCWRAIDRLSDAALLPCIALMFLGCAVDPSAPRVFAALTTLVVYLAIRANALNVWLNQRLIQGLGRISYSIYLLHVPVALVIGGIRVRVNTNSDVFSFAAFASVYVFTVALSHLFYSVVEVPCLKASERLKQWLSLDARSSRR